MILKSEISQNHQCDGPGRGRILAYGVLLLTLIARYVKELITEDMCISETPLFVNELKNGEEHFAPDDATQTEFFKENQPYQEGTSETKDSRSWRNGKLKR